MNPITPGLAGHKGLRGEILLQLKKTQPATAKEKASVVSFVLDGVHAHDIGTIVDKEGA